MNFNSKKFTAAILTSLLFFETLSADTTVDFFGTVSASQDLNMIKMTTDLYYNQMVALDNYTVLDKRGTVYSPEVKSSATIIFYTEIQEDNGSWICTLNAIKNDTKQNVNSTKKYDSYYKMLLDSKSSLENLLTNVTGNIQENAYKDDFNATTATSASIDNLAGTWSGEDFIEKIIILRGGRGFIIFKNGASMNVLVSSDNSIITVTQQSNPNASYFPDLPRQIAMEKALDAKPIVYQLQLASPNVLTGTKTTLAMKNESVDYEKISVRWEKKY